MNRSTDISPVKIAALLALTFVVLGAATWLLLIQPKQSTANNLDSTIAATQAQLAKQTTTHTPSAKATHRHTLSQTVISTRALPNLVAMPQILLQLSRIANEEHVTLVSIAPIAAVPYANYEALPLTVTLTGKFFGIQGFLQQLRNQVRSSGQAGLAATGRLYDVTSVTLNAVTPAPKVSAVISLDAFNYTGFGFATPGGETTTSGTPTSVP
jgi:Pilus assembly protein, PilO